MRIIAGPLHYPHINNAQKRMILGFIRKELRTQKFHHFYYSLIHLEQYKARLSVK
ncbi:hypothetical protein [Acinetobacter sp. GXMZU3951]